MNGKFAYQALKDMFLEGRIVINREVRPIIGRSRESINDVLRKMAYMLEYDELGPRGTRRWWMKPGCAEEMKAFDPLANYGRGIAASRLKRHAEVEANMQAVVDYLLDNGPCSMEEIDEGIQIGYNPMKWAMRNLRGQPRRIFIEDWRIVGGHVNQQTPLYGVGDFPDVPRKKKGQIQPEEMMKIEVTANRAKWVKDFKPRRDIAAAWF